MIKRFLNLEEYDNLLNYLRFDVENLNERLKRDITKNVHVFCRMKEYQLINEGFISGISVDFVAYLMTQYHGVMMTCKGGEDGGEHCVFVYPKIIKYSKPLYNNNKELVYDENGEVIMRNSFKTELFVCDPEADLFNMYNDEKQDRKFDIPLSEFKFGDIENQQYYIYTSMNSENRKNSISDYILNKDKNRRTFKFDDLSGLKVSEEDVYSLSPKNKAYIQIRYNISEMHNRQVEEAVWAADRKANYQAIASLENKI